METLKIFDKMENIIYEIHSYAKVVRDSCLYNEYFDQSTTLDKAMEKLEELEDIVREL